MKNNTIFFHFLFFHNSDVVIKAFLLLVQEKKRKAIQTQWVLYLKSETRKKDKQDLLDIIYLL